MKKQLLINREWHVEGNWYEPENLLNSFKSVLWVDLYDTCSSAGDWSGLFAQLLNGMVHIIPFFQENSYPYSGLRLLTDKVYMTIEFSEYEKLDKQTLKEKIVQEFIYDFQF